MLIPLVGRVAPLPRLRAAVMLTPDMVPPELPIALLADGGNALSSTADELAGSLFGASLFPWLAMLYWLKHPVVGAPSGVSFGLTFLLAFVFGSIPAAIGAGALYGVSLADADWLHGAAESLLAITNCVVVLGFRGAIEGASTQSTVSDDDSQATERLRTAATAFGGLAALSAVAVVASGSAAVHTPWLGGVGNLPSAVWATEPSNALSVPTWIIHTSSLVEWLVAMGLAWRYAEVALACGWTWEMGKEEAQAALANLQSQLSNVLGDSESEGATEKSTPPKAASGGISNTAAASDSVGVGGEGAGEGSALVGWEDLGDAWALDTNAFFLGKLLLLSGALAYVAKYFPALPALVLPDGVPDAVLTGLAAIVIVGPTALNVAKWKQRSEEGAEFVGDI